MKKLFLLYTLIAVSLLQAQEVTIEAYDQKRDEQAIHNIIQQHYDFLSYESYGYPQGETMRYVNSKKYTTLVARCDGQTVGFSNCCASNVSFLTFHIMRGGTIHLIGVDQNYIGKGVGHALLNRTIEKLTAAKVPTIQLAVNTKNERAQKFYKSHGFTPLFETNISKKTNEQRSYFYTKKIDIPADELPQGNIIQRYPKTSAVCAAIATIGIWQKEALSCKIWSLYNSVLS